MTTDSLLIFTPLLRILPNFLSDLSPISLHKCLFYQVILPISECVVLVLYLVLIYTVMVECIKKNAFLNLLLFFSAHINEREIVVAIAVIINSSREESFDRTRIRADVEPCAVA